MSKSKATKKAPARKPAVKKAPPKSAPAKLAALDFSALDLDALDSGAGEGKPLVVPFAQVYEDPANPRTEFDPQELEELAADIEVNGILQPIVTWPRDERGYKIRYGAKRRRAAEIASRRSGVMTVSITINERLDLDDYAQVSENARRSGLTPLDFARFMARKRDKDKHSAAEIARRLKVHKSLVTYHFALLDHPPAIMELYSSGRSTSPKNLYELRILHRQHPVEVERFAAEAEEVTRAAIRELAKRLNGGGEGVGPSNGGDVGGQGGDVGVGPSNAASKAPLAHSDPINAPAKEGQGESSVGPSNTHPPISDPSSDFAGSTENGSGKTNGVGRSNDSGRAEDPTRIRKPLLLAKHGDRAVSVQIYRRPPKPGLVHLKFEDGSGEEVASMDSLTDWVLTESKAD